MGSIGLSWSKLKTYFVPDPAQNTRPHECVVITLVCTHLQAVVKSFITELAGRERDFYAGPESSDQRAAQRPAFYHVSVQRSRGGDGARTMAGGIRNLDVKLFSRDGRGVDFSVGRAGKGVRLNPSFPAGCGFMLVGNDLKL